MKIRLSPLFLFLLLLIVLIVSYIFTETYKPYSKESFIGFYGSTASNTTGLTVPKYSNPVNKLYDNDFFDPINGNILRVYGTAYDSKTAQDTTGTTINHIDIIDRSGKSTTFTKDQQITANTLTSIPNSYLSWSAVSTDSAYSSITSNQLFYIGWGQQTYIHIFDLSNSLNACGYYYSGTGGSPIYTNFNTILPKMVVAPIENNKNNNTYIIDNNPENDETQNSDTDCANKDRNPNTYISYQFTSQILYIPKTGNLRIINKSGNSVIYNRNGQVVSSISSEDTIPSSTTPWTISDLDGNNLVIYIPIQTKTIIAILGLNTDKTTYSLISVKRFNSDGTIQSDENTVVAIPTSGHDGRGGRKTGGRSGEKDGLYGSFLTAFDNNFTSKEKSQMMNNMMRSFKGFMMGNNAGNIGDVGDVNYTNQQINDYILKTQIIPPICPQCPQFPAGTTCSSCGNVAAGPSSRSPVAAAGPSGSPTTFYKELKELGSETKDLIKSTGSGTADLLRSAGSGTKDLLEDTGSGAKDFIKDTASGTKDFIKDTASGTKGFIEDTASGTKQLLEETGSGGKQLLKETAGSITGLAKETASGAVDLTRSAVKGTVGAVKGIGSDIAGLFKDDREQGRGARAAVGGGAAGGVGSAGYYGGSGAKGPQNPWTYNGLLSEKPTSQFIPITADFSKFSR